MADVFISYAREDRKFVQRLHDALAGAGRDSWVDWEGIPASAKWMAEVRAAIDEADCFCFVVSPDSVESPVCREEAAHAAASNKRILPLLHRPVEDGLVPETVAAHNWIEFDDGHDFDRAFVTLVQALETEPEHLRTHTRLLVKAKEWDTSKDRSQLLRGADLSAAEAWLGSSAGKEPAPTQGQTAYVLASRKAASRRQRTVVGAVALALVVSLVLSAIALVQRGEAIAQREEAEAQRREAIEQRNLARSGDLSSASILERERDPELGLLLAIEAAKILRTDRSEEALRQAVRAAHLELLREASELPGDLAFGPGGTWVASADRDSVDTWDTAAGETLLSIPTGRAQASAWGLAVDPRGRWIAAAGRGGTRIWDATTGELLQALPANGIVYQVEFSADGDRLVAGGDDGARLWDPATGEIVLEFGDEQSGTYGADISSDGALVATGHGDGIVRIWDGRTGRLRDELRGHSDLGFFVRFSPRGDRLVSISFDRTARVWDARSGEQVAVLAHDTFVQDAAFIRDDFVVTGDSVGVMRIWNIATGETVSELRGHNGQLTFLAVNPQQDRIVSASDDGSFRLWRLGAGVSSIDVDRPGYQTVAAFRGDGRAFLTAGYGRAIELWDATSGARIADLRLGDEVSAGSAAFSPDGSAIAVAARLADPAGVDGGGAVMLIDASTGELMWSETESGGEVPASVGFAPGGDQIVALWTDGGVRVYGSRGGAIDATYVPRHEASVESGPSLATFAPGGRIVALAERKDVVLWAPEDGTVSRTFRHDAPVRAVAFSPDGRTLAAGSSDATIQLWDVADGTLEATLTGHQGPIETVSFSPRGGFIVSAARDGTARVWNREGEQIQVYQAGGLFVTSAMFSPDGTHVLVGVVIGQDTVPDVVEHDVEVRSTTRVYSCEICLRFDELLHLAESRTTRGFTPEERATYLSVDT